MEVNKVNEQVIHLATVLMVLKSLMERTSAEKTFRMFLESKT